MSNPTWQELKQQGSEHYKTTAGVEPIDLYRAIVPNMDLTAMEVKAFTDAIKYAFRMLQNGTNTSDCDKIVHYIQLAKVCLQDRQPKTAHDLYAGYTPEDLVIKEENS